jgi:putative adhesin
MNKVILSAAVMASLTGSVFAAGVNNTVDPAAVAMGAEAYGNSNTITATGTSAFAVGYNNTVSKDNALVYGNSNTAAGTNSLAGGEYSKAKGRNSVAIGSSAQALSDDTFAIGSQARTNGANTVAIGNGAYSENESALAVGKSARTSGVMGTAVGYGTRASNQYTTALGYQNVASGVQSSAVGVNNEATGDYSAVSGTNSAANGNYALASGFKAKAVADDSIAVGDQSKATGISSLAVGTIAEATGGDAIAAGHSAIATGNLSTAIGSNAEAKADNTIAIGSSAKVTGVSSVVVGRDNNVTGDDTTVIGANNGTVSYDPTTGAVVLDKTISADQSAVVGYNNHLQSSDKEQLIFGSNSITKEQGATVIGSHSKATAIDAFAIGNNIIADVQNGVAIGTNSVTELAVGTTNIKDNTSDIRFSNSTYAGSNPDSVVSFGTNGRAGAGGVTSYTRQLQNVAAGRVSATSTDAINGSQLYDVALEAQKYNTLVDGTNTTVTSQDNAFGRKEYKVNVNRDLTKMNSVQFNTVNDPQRNFVSKDGMHVFDGDVNTNYTSNGMKLENTNNLDTAQYNLDGMVADSNGKHVEFTTSNITAGGQQIHDVAAGTAGTDAVNVNQLTSALNQVNGNASALGNVVKANQQEARKGIAGTAALAGLHPLDFDPDHKLDIMAGYGHFHNANAGAVGIAYRPNEDLMFTAGTTFGSDNVINAGISYKVGARSEVSRSKVAMARDLADAKREIAQLQADNEKFKSILNAVLGLDLPQNDDVVFADVPQNHWAYAAVQDLANRGLVNGYEDGLFKGDRTLTRYEFAQVVYNAIQRAKETNQSIDQRLVEEFKPELMRYSIEGKVHERVHVNKSTKEVKRNQYGTIVK